MSAGRSELSSLRCMTATAGNLKPSACQRGLHRRQIDASRDGLFHTRSAHEASLNKLILRADVSQVAAMGAADVPV